MGGNQAWMSGSLCLNRNDNMDSKAELQVSWAPAEQAGADWQVAQGRQVGKGALPRARV